MSGLTGLRRRPAISGWPIPISHRDARHFASTLRLLATIALGVAALHASAALAAAPAPAWDLTISSEPTNFAPGAISHNLGAGVSLPVYTILATNIGAAATSGPVTLTDTLPPGLTPSASRAPEVRVQFDGTPTFSCSVSGQTIECTSTESLRAGGSVLMEVPVDVAQLPDPTVLTDRAAASGGGTDTVEAAGDTTISSSLSPFGFTSGRSGLGALPTDASGAPVTLAGARPYQLTVDLNLANQILGRFLGVANGAVRDVETNLPRGLIVNPSATVRCTEAEFESASDEFAGCPQASQVGVATVTTVLQGVQQDQEAIFNMVPPPGAPASLGFDALGVGIMVHLLGGVHAGDYALSAKANQIIARPGNPVLGIRVQLWGDPSSAAHDAMRYPCQVSAGGSCPVEKQNTAFLTMPTVCEASLAMSASVDSWSDPGNFVFRSAPITDAKGNPTGSSGCEQLDFSPQIDLQPTTRQAASPSGVDFDLQVPQPEGLNTLAEANVKRVKVTLPEGVAVNPSAADGLRGCAEAQIGLTQESPAVQFDNSDPTCPDGSVVGSGSITTPLLRDPLAVTLYLADPNDNPFHALLAGYLVAQGSGVRIKLAGRFDLNPQTGQITGTFDDNPQLPFDDLKLHFKSGTRGVLVTPPTCGPYQTISALTPWSGTPPVMQTPSFTIDQNCSTGGFAPQLTAGVTNPVGGSSSSFVLRLTRQDGEQNVSGLTTVLPPGLLAKLAGVPLCSDLLATTGDCPAGSQVGSAMVGVGVGPTPVYVPQAGKSPTAVYLAGAYKGAPFSLVIKVPAQAGPFDLGVVTVRAALYVDRSDAHVTAVSDALPQIIQGIPLPYRDIRVNIDRPGFILAPTSCDPMAIAASVTGAPLGGPVGVNGAGVGFASSTGTVAQLSNPFQVGGCAALPFKPSLTVSTQGRTSKANGASLTVKVAQAAGEANIRKVDLTLPLVLPARLTTLQKACTEAQFAANPAGCPAESFVGTAKGLTPLLGVPLTGPAILVSHGGAAFPDVVFLLQANERGGSIRIDLVGHTLIKKGITYSRFESVPDAPISSFEASFPQGPHSVLSANGNLCTSKLLVPTELVAQNGAKLNQSTRVSVTGCPKTKVLTRAQKLALALKACHKKHNRAKRTTCERAARKKYGSVKKKAKK